MNNYKLLIEYDGTNYSGWQIQSNAMTVQQKISDALKILVKEDINLIGSGRTDAGVHAIGQIANFRYPDELDLYRFKHSLNSILPNDIVVKSIENVDADFHSRFDAKKRTYVYLISQTKSAFYKNYSHFYPEALDIDLLNNLSQLLIGDKDFTSFSKKNTEIDNFFCNVFTARWRKRGDLIIFLISANRFLHGMVRSITGTLLRALKSEDSIGYINNVIKAKNREIADESVSAKGLFLFKVEY